MEKNVTEIEFRFKFIVSRTEIQQEKIIISYRDFIGSVGGSLGLFLGFSVFSYVTDLFSKLVEKIAPSKVTPSQVHHTEEA